MEYIDPDSIILIGELMAKLPERNQLILTMVYKEGYSYREIGSELNISDSRVGQLVLNSIWKMRRMLGIWEVAEHTTSTVPVFIPIPLSGAEQTQLKVAERAERLRQERNNRSKARYQERKVEHANWLALNRSCSR